MAIRPEVASQRRSPMTSDHSISTSKHETLIEDRRAVLLLARLVHAFRAREIELSFIENDMAILKRLAAEGFVDLSNDGFSLKEKKGRFIANSQEPPVTAKGVLFLERLPIDKFVDQPGMFRFLGWL